MLAPKLEACSSVVFTELLPPLQALTGLPAIRPQTRPASALPSADLGAVDLALCVLSFLRGKDGPGSIYLRTVREYFDRRPDQLRLLARYSLECGILITPVMIPLAPAHYQRYESAMMQWVEVRSTPPHQVTEQEIDLCLAIQQTLLACAEDVNYPAAHYLLALLQSSDKQAAQPWSMLWQTIILQRLETGHYVEYQQLPLLWSMFFPAQQLQPLAEKVLEHCTAADSTRRRYAQKLISSFTGYLRDVRDLRYLSYLRDSNNLSYLRYLNYLRYLRDPGNLSYLRYLRHLSSLRYLRHLSYLRYLSNLSYLSYLRDLSSLSNLSYLNYLSYLSTLRDLLITKTMAEKVCLSLRTVGQAEKIDRLIILQGRILHVQEHTTTGPEVEKEVRLLAWAALQELAMPGIGNELQEAALGVLRALPGRTVTEIALMWEILRGTQDEHIQQACADALHYARPRDTAALQELEKGRSCPAAAVREAVENVLTRKLDERKVQREHLA